MANALFDASCPETRLLAASTNPIRLAAFVLWTLTRFLDASPPPGPNPSLPSTNALAKSVARVLESQAATSSLDVKDNMDAVNAVYADLQRVVTALCQVLQSYSTLQAGLMSAMRDSEIEVASRKSMGNAFKIARRLVDCLMCEGVPHIVRPISANMGEI
ncbi:hypothetical protein BC830DRAFT_1154868 [Chytriomyces sp. MP71]|nr:hypothetical protein BC830DRAFT_1154868 [Chytriomyces sp. MP71]